MQTKSPQWAPDVDHEIAQLLALHRLFREKGYKSRYSGVVKRALRVAYATHFRALMEFFHDGRPSDTKSKHAAQKQKKSDVRYSRVTGGTNPFAHRWTKRELKRFEDADKLSAHLTDQRAVRRGKRGEWGDDDDWRLMRPLIQDFLKRTKDQGGNYPRTVRAAQGLGLA
jgi:hypothetical protein